MDKNHDRLTQSDLDRFIIAATEETNERLKAINDNLPYDGNFLANFGPVSSLLGKKDNFLLDLLDKTVTLEALNGISKLNKNNIDFTNLNEEEIIQTIIKRYNLNNLKSIKDIIFNLLTLRQIPTLYYLNEYYNYYRDKPSVKDYESINQPNLLRYYDRDLKNNYGLIKLRPETIVYISQIPPRIYDLEKNITVFTYTEKKLTDLFNFLYINNLKMEIAHEMGFNYNSLTNKVESNAPQNTLMGQAENVLAGEQVGGQISKKLVEMGEQALIQKYNSQK